MPSSRHLHAAGPSRQRGIVRWLYLLLALFSLALGIVGAFLPVLPTVPFILLAAWAAARSSPRLERWIDEHPRFGPPVRAWRQRGAVPRTAKWAATFGMSGSSILLLVIRPGWLAVLAIAGMALVGAWLWRRPEG